MHLIMSLFSGAGGFDWGFHMSLRFKTVVSNEILRAPCETFARNFGMRLVKASALSTKYPEKIVINDDISNVSFELIKNTYPKIDVVIGGPPCQDFSIVKGNSREGINVRRGKLYMHFVRALASIQPKLFIFENVPGLISSNNGQAYRQIIDDFSNLNVRWKEIQETLWHSNGIVNAEIGYEILFSGVVNTSFIGVPQARRRLIMIGIRKDLSQKIGSEGIYFFKKELINELSGNNYLFKKYPLSCIE
ncbi:MAG: DNA cytosine methyltransferase, partial [Nitrososphaerota archaeon]